MATVTFPHDGAWLRLLSMLAQPVLGPGVQMDGIFLFVDPQVFRGSRGRAGVVVRTHTTTEPQGRGWERGRRTALGALKLSVLTRL